MLTTGEHNKKTEAEELEYHKVHSGQYQMAPGARSKRHKMSRSPLEIPYKGYTITGVEPIYVENDSAANGMSTTINTINRKKTVPSSVHPNIAVGAVGQDSAPLRNASK